MGAKVTYYRSLFHTSLVCWLLFLEGEKIEVLQRWHYSTAFGQHNSDNACDEPLAAITGQSTATRLHRQYSTMPACSHYF